MDAIQINRRFGWDIRMGGSDATGFSRAYESTDVLPFEAMAQGHRSINIKALDLEGVKRFSLEFLDDRLTYIEIEYDDSTKWENPESFAAKLSETMKLPDAWQNEHGRSILKCAGFNIIASASSYGGPSVVIENPLAKEIREKRQKALEEKQRKEFTP
jgi:hypothetical protein